MKGNSERIVIAANFTVEPLSDPLYRLLTKVSRVSEIEFAPYNQIFQQLLDPRSLFHTNRKGINVVFLRLEDLVDSRGVDIEFVRMRFDKIKANALELAKRFSAAERFSVPLFVFLCPASAGIQSDLELATAFAAIEDSIRETVANFSNLFVFGTDQIRSRYRIAKCHNPKGNVLGHLPYTTEFISALAAETARKIDAYHREPFKVLVLDCDNTLWDGVIGEDGVEGIGLSEKRLFLQNFAREQSEAGMVVCLISKNNESDVWEVFEKRNDMVLKKEHIVSARINWLPKSQNLKSIAEELQLGLNSFVFVDDDAAVCEEVRRNCPEVLTILLPSGSDDLHGFFDNLWVFDKLKITNEDRERTRSYQDRVRRAELQSQVSDMGEFIKSLELVCEISALSIEDIPRVSQLTLRTNQFNSMTIRLTEANIRTLISDGNRTVWTVRVRDRFGDYGLVGVVIFAEEQDSLTIESFMLSCRILGRGVEHQIVKELGKIALASDRRLVSFSYVPTKKNAPMLNFLTEICGQHKTNNDGQAIFTLPASIAVECAPRSDLAAELTHLVVHTQKPEDATEHMADRAPFQDYIELALSLSTNGSLILNETCHELSRDNLGSEFRAAQTDTEKKLTQIWEKVLSAKNIGTADNFFEIGGDSLVAVALFLEIEEQFGRSLPISSLIDAATIERLALLIELGPETPIWTYLVPIQPEGTRPPLFCMHAAGGNVLFYRDLAKGLGNDQPVYGLQARGIADKSETAHDRVEDMAAEYSKEICQLDPVGPYRLCGSSFGGLVAFECAKQLLDAGKSVAILAVFDTYAPEYLNNNSLKPAPFSSLHQSIERVRNTASQLREVRTLNEQISFVFDRIRRLKHRQKRKILWKKNEIATQYNKATGRRLPNDISRNHKAIRKAEDDYHPESYDGGLILFRASDQPKTVLFDPFLGWKVFIKHEITVEVVKGTHGAIAVSPFASELAAKFNRYLNQAQISAEPRSEIAGEEMLAHVCNSR